MGVKWTKVFDSEHISTVINGRNFIIYPDDRLGGFKLASFKPSHAPIYYPERFKTRKIAIKFVDGLPDDKPCILDKISKAREGLNDV